MVTVVKNKGLGPLLLQQFPTEYAVNSLLCF